MDQKWTMFKLFLWIIIIIIFNTITEACVFYSKYGHDTEHEGVRFIRVREDIPIGENVITLRAYPRQSIVLKGMERSQDYKYFKIKDINETTFQVLLNKSIDDLVDRDVPQNLLKFKIECSSKMGDRNEETSSLGITVYIEDVNDHSPKFLNLPYSIHVDESTPVNTVIFQNIAAFDRDKPNTPNSDVQYSIGTLEPGSPAIQYFSLESPHRPLVVLRKPLDFDEGIRYFELLIIATDRGYTPRNSNTTLKIYIDDHDDLPPKFTEGVYRTRINEFYPLIGKTIKIPLFFNPPIMAFDQDSLNSTLIYDVIAGNERKLFWVNPTNGVLYLHKEIDLEEESLPGNTFVLQMEARQKDNQLKRAVARIEIEILDLNDNAPEFEVDIYNISIVENLPTGFSVLQVNAIDRDQGENAEFYYNINVENPPGAFTIEPHSGWITVRDQSLLDREIRQSITMKIEAIEKQQPYDERRKDAGMVQVEVTLLDTNDNTPQFEMGNLYEFRINVNSPIGHIVGHVHATDPDEGRNGMILYELQQPRGSGVVPFKIDRHTGTLVVSAQLKTGRVAVFVDASDQPINPSERRFSLAVVTIEVVQEILDGYVDFIGAPYEFWVGADVNVGASIGQIRTNADGNTDGEVMYDLLHSYVDGVPFAVEERSGIVTVIRDLDDFDRQNYEFEAVAAHHYFDKPYGQLVRKTLKSEKQITKNGEAIEIDEGIISDSEDVLVTNVTIHVVSPDDDRGILMRGTHTDPIEFYVKENIAGALIGQLLYKNMTKTKEFRELPGFPKKEVFSVKNYRKDRQLNSKFNKNGTRFEKPPIKSKRKYRDSNSETSFYIAAVTPTILFDDQFAEEGATSTATPFDDPDAFTATTTATTIPTDVTIFITQNYNPKIEEVETHKHTSYEHKTVIDSRTDIPDSIYFKNYETTKVQHPNHEDVNNDSSNDDDVMEYVTRSTRTPATDGIQLNNNNNNNEQDNDKTIEVIITPRPLLRVARQRNLLIVNNTNAKLEYSRKRSTPITASSAGGAGAAASSLLSSSSNHSNRVLRFLIANQQDVTDMISISNDGTLKTLKALDREERDTYRLTIIAEYSKGFITGAGIYQVIVHVDDVNDNPPVFNHISYTGMITENCPLGTEVFLNKKMIIKDADINENAEFNVSLSGDGSHLFTIEYINNTDVEPNNGTTVNKLPNIIGQANKNKHHINLEKSFANLQIMFMDSPSMKTNISYYVVRYIGPITLDREKDNFYSLRVLAKDRGGLSSEVKLNIVIADVNDNAPIFSKIGIFKDVRVEIIDSSGDLEIYYIDRVEDDALPLLSYPMVNTNNQNDAEDLINRIGLSNLLSERLNYAGTPRLIASSSSSNNTSIFNRKKRTITSTSLIRRSHKITKKHIAYPLFSIYEDISVGMTILKLTATDDDYEENSQVFYEIVSEIFIPVRNSRGIHLMKYFNIDRLSGELKINRPLQAESEIHLNVSAKDVGGLKDYTVLKFKVLDVNNHAPVFEKTWYTFDINEGIYNNAILGNVIASDEDYGDNANISYSIQSKDSTIPFKISRNNGVLSVTGELDRESQAIYVFKIIASDNSKSEKKLSSLADIEINILDVNDNAPEFLGYDDILFTNDTFGNQQKIPIYKAYLNKNVEPGTLVKQIAAVDKDFSGNGNGLIMYTLNHNKIPYLFEIDSRDGIITTISKFNSISNYEHINLTIIASDLGNPSKTSIAMLIINLQGESHTISDENNNEEQKATNDDDDDVNKEESNLFPNNYYEIEIVENNIYPMILLQINATAPHKERMFKWSIVPEENNNNLINNDDIFKIDPENGTLWLVLSLDREQQDLYKIKIRAEPVSREGRNLLPIIKYPINGNAIEDLLKNEVRIIIKVTDANDNEPKFIGNGRPIIAVIPNTANFGFPITKVQAIDGDIGLNSEIRYSILNEPFRLFGIDAVTGRIRVLGPITGEQRVYGFDVKATDRRGADDGKSSIVNVFVYVLDENRQVRLVLLGRPVDVEKEIEDLKKTLSEATGLDIRIRLLEPHIDGDSMEPSTDVYIYGVDPHSNSIIDMEDLQNTMSGIAIENLTTSAQILELSQLGRHNTNHRPSYILNGSTLKSTELASIILAVIVFAGGLATALCVVCVRYKRRQRNADTGLTYSISDTPSTLRAISKAGSLKKILPLMTTLGKPTQQQLYAESTNQRERPREYIDVPLPQSVINSNYNLMNHEPNCLRYNQIHHNHQTILMDTSGASLQSSGRDSGLDLSRDQNIQPTPKHILRLVHDTAVSPPAAAHHPNSKSKQSGNRIRTNCKCNHMDGHGCTAEDSSDSYDDSLKNMQVARRTSLPKTAQGFRRSITKNPIVGNRGVMRHSFSGFRDDPVNNNNANVQHQRRDRLGGVARASVSDLEERLRNLERSFREPFHLTNSQC